MHSSEIRQDVHDVSQSDFPPLSVPQASALGSRNYMAGQVNLGHFAATTKCTQPNQTQSAVPQGSRQTRMYGTKKATNTEIKTVP